MHFAAWLSPQCAGCRDCATSGSWLPQDAAPQCKIRWAPSSCCAVALQWHQFSIALPVNFSDSLVSEKTTPSTSLHSIKESAATRNAWPLNCMPTSQLLRLSLGHVFWCIGCHHWTHEGLCHMAFNKILAHFQLKPNHPKPMLQCLKRVPWVSHVANAHSFIQQGSIASSAATCRKNGNQLRHKPLGWCWDAWPDGVESEQMVLKGSERWISSISPIICNSHWRAFQHFL